MTDLTRYDFIMARVRSIYKARDKIHKGAWKEAGWIDSINHIESKARRVIRFRRRTLDELSNDDIEKLIDDAMDLINYTAFLIDNVEQRREIDDF